MSKFFSSPLGNALKVAGSLFVATFFGIVVTFGDVFHTPLAAWETAASSAIVAALGVLAAYFSEHYIGFGKGSK